MSDKIGDKKISGVSSTTKTADVEGTDAVSSVGQVKGTSSVTGVQGAGAIKASRLTRTMSFEERETILRMVQEETQKLIKEGTLPMGKAAVVADAVKMAIDSGLIEKDDGKGKKKS